MVMINKSKKGCFIWNAHLILLSHLSVIYTHQFYKYSLTKLAEIRKYIN